MIVATLGRPERLGALVDVVLADPGTLELVVVVDGPDATSVGVLEGLARKRPRVRPVPIGHVGHLRALEVGVRQATGEVVVLLDDDVLPAPGTIAGHAAHHRHRGGLVVAGPMPVVVPGGRAGSVGTRLYAAEYDRHVASLLRGERPVLDVLWAGNLSMRRADCLGAGLGSVDFRTFYHSDRDLGYRLASAGLVGRFDPALMASHLHQRSDDDFLRDARRQGAGRAELHRVHAGRLGPFTPRAMVADLSPPLAVAVRLAGTTRAASALASGLMGLGRWSARRGHGAFELAAARLARRVMQCRGAVAGEGG
ncbi:MAG: glycosyltransferase [Acidimicrobiales bacterium]